ncbi:bifunctional phosphoglucose/phosphomannose isomerase [Candidatus Woesearchaeota archaeon]|nr:bifunctional phosphoglucose/phosphomannose isomerase [Candidatus Woesearchaeota archaeon]
MAEEEMKVDDEKVFPDDYYEYDKEDMKSIIQGFASQINLAYRQKVEVNFDGEINKVIIAGMGGSAIAGDILKAYLHKEKTPIIVNRDYDLPNDADTKTLVVISSYSGNTEETISSYKDALRKGCKTVIITSGGKLSNMAITNRTQVIKIPRDLQPRAALGYSFFPMLRVMEILRITGNHKKEVEHLVKGLDKKIFMETGINLSEKLVGRVPIIYSSELFGPVAYRWKTQLNENSKVMAFYNLFPELNHNELSSTKNLTAKFHCIMIRTDLDPHRVVKRMEITKDRYRKQGIDVTDIAIKGDTLLTKLFSSIYIGDWTSYFLALRYETDPTPVNEVEELKKALGTYIA